MIHIGATETLHRLAELLNQEFELTGERTSTPHFYHVKTKIVTYSQDGTQTNSARYLLHLMCQPESPATSGMSTCTCAQVTLQRGNGTSVSIPALEGFSYQFRMERQWFDDKEQAYGIPHEKFEGLRDSCDEKLPVEVLYQVYSLFRYFHDYTHGLLTMRHPQEDLKINPGGKENVQNLKKIGQQIILTPIRSEIPLNLGGYYIEGSTFRGRDFTVQFKGVSLVGGVPCAILGFDSGGTFRMTSIPMPEIEIKTVGESHIHGEVYVDVASKWEKQLFMLLTDIAQITLGKKRIGSCIIETTLSIQAVERKNFHREWDSE